MKINSEITQDTRFVQLNTGIVQQLIHHNKKQMRELQTEADYLKYLIANKYWPNANPLDFGVISQRNYEMLNRAKDDLRSINKEIKLLSFVQYSLKASIR